MSFRGIRRCLEILLVTMLAPIIVSCASSDKNDSKEETNTNQEIETIYSESAKIISNEEADCIDSFDDIFINFSCFQDYFRYLPTGKILLFSGNEKFPNGFLRKVTSTGNNRIATTSATLEEAIEQTEFSVSSHSSSSKFSNIKLADGVSEISNSFGIPSRLNIDKCFNNTLCVNGNLDLDFSFGLDGRIRHFKFEYLNFSSEIRKSLELNAWANSSISFNDNLNIADYYGTPIITPSGIVFVPYFNVDLNVAVSAEGNFDFGFRKTDVSRINLSYSNGSWNFNKSNERDLDYTTLPELATLNSNTRVSVDVQAGVLVYGVAGATIGGEAFAKLDANTSSNPWWTLNAGMNLGLTLKAGVFGYGLEYNKTITTLEKTLLEADSGINDGEDNNNGNQDYLTDSRDGKNYPIKEFGTQTWMTKNLDYRGTSYHCYDENSSNCTNYGALYNISQAGSVCPSGWHLPNLEEWKTLASYLGFSPQTYGRVESTTEEIARLFTGGDLGLSIQKAGYFYANSDKYIYKDTMGTYWLSTPGEYISKIDLDFRQNENIINVEEGDSLDSRSVRCVKN